MQQDTSPNSMTGSPAMPSPASGPHALQSHLEQVQQAINRQLAEISAQVAEAESATLERARAELMRQMEADRAALSVQREHVEALSAQAAEQRRQAEAEITRLEQLRRDIEQQTQQLSARAAELDSEASAVSHMKGELTRQRADLDAQLLEIGKGRADVQNRRDQFAAQTKRTIGLLRQQQHKQTAKLESMRAEADEHKRTLKQQVSAELQAERKQLEDDRAALENLREGLALRQEELQRRHNEQRQKQQELESSRAAIEERTREVEASIARMQGQQERQQHRTVRMKRMKQLLKQHRADVAKEKASVETARRCARQVVEQRDSVLEMQRLLLEAEHRMIFRWGLEKSLGWIGRGLIMIVLLMVGSYFVAGQFSEKTWAASAILQQEGAAGDAQAWLETVRQRLSTNEGVRDVLTNMHQQGGSIAGRPQVVAQQLAEQLTLQSPAAGTVVMELRGPNRDELVPVLNAAARMLAGSRSLTAKAADAPPQWRMAQEPKLLSRPIEDNQLMLAAMIFGGSMPVALILVAAMAWMLCRTARRETEVKLELDSPLWQNMAQQLNTGAVTPTPADAATRREELLP